MKKISSISIAIGTVSLIGIVMSIASFTVPSSISGALDKIGSGLFFAGLAAMGFVFFLSDAKKEIKNELAALALILLGGIIGVVLMSLVVSINYHGMPTNWASRESYHAYRDTVNNTAHLWMMILPLPLLVIRYFLKKNNLLFSLN